MRVQPLAKAWLLAITSRRGNSPGREPGCKLGLPRTSKGTARSGDYVRTHRGVHIGQKSKIGNFVWMFPDVLLTNDPNPPSEVWYGPHVGDFAVIAARVVLLPGVKVGKHVFIAAQSLVGIDVPDETMASGNPAKILSGNVPFRVERRVVTAPGMHVTRPCARRAGLVRCDDAQGRRTAWQGRDGRARAGSRVALRAVRRLSSAAASGRRASV